MQNCHEWGKKLLIMKLNCCSYGFWESLRCGVLQMDWAILARCDGNCTPTTLEDTKFRKADLGPQWKHQNFREHLDNTVLSGGLIVNSMVDCHRIID